MRAMASSKVSSTDVLLREFTHRVKNEFASAIQVVSFAAEKSADRNVKAALEGVMEKLHDYASVHRALQMPSGNDCIDASAYLRDLCGSISRSKLENKNIELVLVDRPFRMSSERCWLLRHGPDRVPAIGRIRRMPRLRQRIGLDARGPARQRAAHHRRAGAKARRRV